MDLHKTNKFHQNNASNLHLKGKKLDKIKTFDVFGMFLATATWNFKFDMADRTVDMVKFYIYDSIYLAKKALYLNITYRKLISHQKSRIKHMYLKPFTIAEHVQQAAWIRLWHDIFVEKFITADMNLNLRHWFTSKPLCQQRSHQLHLSLKQI